MSFKKLVIKLGDKIKASLFPSKKARIAKLKEKQELLDAELEVKKREAELAREDARKRNYENKTQTKTKSWLDRLSEHRENNSKGGLKNITRQEVDYGPTKKQEKPEPFQDSIPDGLKKHWPKKPG